MDLSAINSIREKRINRIFEDTKLSSLRSMVDQFQVPHTKVETVFNQTIVQLGSREQLSIEQQTQLRQLLEQFCPWKKGPFSFFGTEIDSEWRSDWKWSRFFPNENSEALKGKRIADVGCNNGYYMLRALAHEPAEIIGFEPNLRHFIFFEFIKKLIGPLPITLEPLGVEHLDLYPQYFDVVLLLGILYHHTDPVGLLRKVRQSMAPYATLYVDCQGIDSAEDIALVPRRRYAGATGVWFVPSKSCIGNWLARAGFEQIECIYSAPLTVDEQRTTKPWADIASLSDFLNPKDPRQTIEGYPAPWRHYFVCKNLSAFSGTSR